MTFERSGNNASSLDPCVSSQTFGEEYPNTAVAKTWEYADNGLRRHAEIVIIEDYFVNMMESFRYENNRSPASVSLFINIYTCKERCSAILAELAREHPSTNFYIGYKHMHARNVLTILDVLSGVSNLYFGDVSSPGIYYVQDYIVCDFISDRAPGVLYGARDDFRMGDTPVDTGDNWSDRAMLIGRDGWSYAQFLFFHPNGDLYAVFHGNLNKDVPPTDDDHPWLSHSTTVGDYGWSRYSFLFFDHVGILYAASSSGLYKGLPPRGVNDNWHDRAITIGSTGWDSLQFLFMHPTDFMMYAVKDGAFYRGSPPSEEISADDWIDQALQIGTNGWDAFKFLFFHPCGLLFAAGYDGSLRVASPPQYGTDNWYSRSTLVGTYGWEDFQFLFFHPSDRHA